MKWLGLLIKMQREYLEFKNVPTGFLSFIVDIALVPIWKTLKHNINYEMKRRMRKRSICYKFFNNINEEAMCEAAARGSFILF